MQKDKECALGVQGMLIWPERPAAAGQAPGERGRNGAKADRVAVGRLGARMSEENMPSLVCAEELVYTEIKQRILAGRLLPGTRLVHRNLAKDLGVSPNPVVLALRMLERDGLVTNTPGLGACVRRFTQSEMIDLYRLRAVQEGFAARLCAERATPADIESIRQANLTFQASIDQGDADANIQADIEFHTTIVRAARCPDLELMVENLAIMRCSMRSFGLSLNIPRMMSPSNKSVHDPLLKALEEGDPDAAERLGREHVENSLSRNLSWIEDVSAAANDPSLRPRWRASESVAQPKT